MASHISFLLNLKHQTFILQNLLQQLYICTAGCPRKVWIRVIVPWPIKSTVLSTIGLFRLRRNHNSSRLLALVEGNPSVTGRLSAQSCSFAKYASMPRRIHAVVRNGQRTVTNRYQDGTLKDCDSVSLIARFMGPTWVPSGAGRTQMGPTMAPWFLLSG